MARFFDPDREKIGIIFPIGVHGGGSTLSRHPLYSLTAADRPEPVREDLGAGPRPRPFGPHCASGGLQVPHQGRLYAHRNSLEC